MAYVISLDFDGTYSHDPDTWDRVVKLFKDRGWRVIGATMRFSNSPYNDDPAFQRYLQICDQVIFTAHKAKAVRLQELGIRVDIWIDDNPAWLYTDAT